MARRKGGCLKGCVVVPLIIVLVLVVAVVAGAAIILNKTPAELGFADQEIMSGKSLRDMGLADTKLKEVFTFLKEMMSPDESKIVTNGYTEESEAEAESSLAGSSLNNGTSINYAQLLGEDPVTYDQEYLYVYNDTTLAYILDTAIKAAADGADADLSDVKNMNASLMELTITKEGSSAKLRTVFALDVSSIKNQIAAQLGGGGNLIPLPNKVYIVCYYSMTADLEGKLVLTPESIKINDSDNAVSQAIFSVLSEQVSQKTEGEESDASINNLFAKVIVKLVWNLGKTGEAEVNPDHSISGSKVIGGNYGIFQHKLHLITHVAAPEGE